MYWLLQTGGANVQCEGRLWRLDVGMSCGVLNAAPQVLICASCVWHPTWLCTESAAWEGSN